MKTIKRPYPPLRGWQMTRTEFIEEAKSQPRPTFWGPFTKETETLGLKHHRVVVERALQEGKPVPAEVLAEYPDLARLFPKPPAVEMTPDIKQALAEM